MLSTSFPLAVSLNLSYTHTHLLFHSRSEYCEGRLPSLMHLNSGNWRAEVITEQLVNSCLVIWMINSAYLLFGAPSQTFFLVIYFILFIKQLSHPSFFPAVGPSQWQPRHSKAVQASLSTATYPSSSWEISERYTISATCSGSGPWSPTSWPCSQEGHDLISEPPQLAPLDMRKRRIFPPSSL